MIVDEEHVVRLESVSEEVAVTVILVLDFHDGVDPRRRLVALVLVIT